MVYDENDRGIVLSKEKAITIEMYKKMLENKKSRLNGKDSKVSKSERITLSKIKKVLFLICLLGWMVHMFVVFLVCVVWGFSSVYDFMCFSFFIFPVAYFIITVADIFIRLSYKEHTVTCVGYLYGLTRDKHSEYLVSAPLFLYETNYKKEFIYDCFLDDTTKAPDIGDEIVMRVGEKGAEDCYIKPRYFRNIMEAVLLLIIDSIVLAMIYETLKI